MTQTLKSIILLFTIGKTVKEAITDDGKVDFGESMEISMKALGLVSVFKNLKKIKEELQSSTNEQREAAVALFRDQFSLTNEEAELKVEMGISLLVSLVNMVWPKENEEEV